MQFDGEHLWIGQLGHFFVLLAFTASLLSTIGYFIASKKTDALEKFSWIRFARINFFIQALAVVAVFTSIFYICSHHYLEYLYAYKHTSKELEYKYLLACIWEDQSGSFLLWTIWHCVLGTILIIRAKDWEAPVMTVVSFAQVFLAMMIMGVYLFGGIKIGNSPFVLTRIELGLENAPMLQNLSGQLAVDYLHKLKGIGLNVLLRNYWMVIHPPILFLGFASTIVPFAYAYAGIQTKRYTEWIKPALPFTLFSVCVLGVGIMMGAKWAYESLTFGGYWAWDPVENASLVPWLILVAGLHTMLIYKATGHALRASYLFMLLGFVFILYSTFLTRTGILADTSVHAFTEAGKAMNILICSFLLVFAIAAILLFAFNYKKIPAVEKEESTSSREFWMFIGSVVFFLAALFIIAKTSLPVINYLFNSKLAQPEDVEFSYNKVIILVAVIIGLLSAITQYLKYKSTPTAFVIKKLLWPTIISLVITTLLIIVYPITYDKKGPGFLIAIYIALYAVIYAAVANAWYIWAGVNGKLRSAGASVAHFGFALMLIGILISAGNKKIISEEKFKSFVVATGIDPVTKQQDDPAENINLVRDLPTTMDDYSVTYYGDSVGKETDRQFYHVLFQRKDPVTQQLTETFTLNPDVYQMRNNNFSSNPDTKHYLTHDVFTYISYAMAPGSNVDTAQFKIQEAGIGDTVFYSKGYMVLNKIISNPKQNKFNFPLGNFQSLMADITVTSKDSNRYSATPIIYVDNTIHRAGDSTINQIDDTVYAQNLFLRFAGIGENRKIKLGVKESNAIIDFVTLKAYVFPYINIVWLGLVFMAIGVIISLIKRIDLSKRNGTLVLLIFGMALFYMFLLASR
jgi:cytochrome c-type biogenesis protein CcmF